MAYTLHQRAEWLQFGARGMSGPSQATSSVRAIVIHYNGGNANLAGGDIRYANVIADMNDGYWSSRGYALGYNWMCAPDGDLWISRGTDIRCAANGCQEVNVPWVAIQVTTTSVEAEPTPQQLDALKNQWVPTIRGWYGNDLAVHVVGHRDINPMCSNPTGTICPGPRLYPRVQAGFFDTPGAPPPPPPTGDDDMALLIASSDGTAEQKNTWFLQVGATLAALPTSQTRTDVVALGTIRHTIDSNNQQPWRNYTVSDIQALINGGWTGPRGAAATAVGGYTIPADPAAAPAAAAKAAADAAKLSADAARQSAADAASNSGATLLKQNDVLAAIDAIDCGGGTGGGPLNVTLTGTATPTP